jgi:hypothetical protein
MSGKILAIFYFSGRSTSRSNKMPALNIAKLQKAIFQVKNSAFLSLVALGFPPAFFAIFKLI